MALLIEFPRPTPHHYHWWCYNIIASHGRVSLRHSATKLPESNNIACHPGPESTLEPLVTSVNASLFIPFKAQLRVGIAQKWGVTFQRASNLEQPVKNGPVKNDNFIFQGTLFSSPYTTVHYSTLLQYTTLQYITLHYSTLHYTTLNYTTLQYSTVQYSTVQTTLCRRKNILQCVCGCVCA